MSQFIKHFNNNGIILTDGPMETRIEYNTDIKLDQEMSIFLLTENQTGRTALNTLYTEDIQSVIPYGIPIILNAPLFRASAQHCQRLGLSTTVEKIKEINHRGIELVQSVRRNFTEYEQNIIITVPIGPKYAGFSPDKKSTIESEIEYHTTQIAAADEQGVDVISIAVMPGATEAIGAAIAASTYRTPYTVGFALQADGCLLDGTPADAVIEHIESSTQSHPPAGYIIGCTHAQVATQALSHISSWHHKIIGIKANGSNKPPKALLELKQPLADPPVQFARDLLNLGRPRGFKIYGGCCGTNSKHIQSLAQKINLDLNDSGYSKA